MTHLNSIEYYQKRSAHARALERSSVSGEIATLYRQMAESYDNLAAAASSDHEATKLVNPPQDSRRNWSHGAERSMR